MFISERGVLLSFLRKLVASIIFVAVFFRLISECIFAQSIISSVKTTAAIPNSITISSLVQIAIENNPELIAMRREFDAAQARTIQVKALPDPEIMFGNATQGNPIPFTGLRGDFSEVSLGITQDLPWFGNRNLRWQIASSESEAKFQEYEIATRQIKAEIKSTCYELYTIDHILTVIKRDIDILDKIAKIAEVRYSVGQAQQTDIINARVEITELIEKQSELEAKRITLVAKINSLLFRDPSFPIEKLSDITFNLQPPSSDEITKLALSTAPEIKRNRRLIDASNHAIRLAEREAKYPEIGLSFAYHNRPAFPDYYTYGITLKLPLYAATKQRQGIKEQTDNLAAARARLASAEITIKYRLRDAHVRATTSARLIKLNVEGLFPQATLALESSMASYEVGKVDFLTLLVALKRTINYETRYWELIAEYQKAIVEIESLSGLELTN